VWTCWKHVLPALLVTVLTASPALAYDPPPNAIRTGLAWEHLVRRDGGPGEGAGAFVGYRGSLSDDWDGWVQVAWAALPRKTGPASDLMTTTAGFSLVLDDSMFRPEIFLGAGILASLTSRDIPVNGMVLVGAALEYQPIRWVSIGVRAELRIPFLHRQDIPSLTSLALYATWPF
jgi:hypothetical protein